MLVHKKVLVLGCVLALGLAGCSRQQSDWQKAREANTADAYEQFLKNYPTGEFTAQAKARLKELYEERDWQRARDADTVEAYQAFLKQHPEGKWTEEARIRVENFTLAQTPGATAPGSSTGPGSAAGTSSPTPQGSAAAQGRAAPQPSAAPPASATSGAGHTAGGTPSATAAAPANAAGSYGVQLGAFKSGADAANKHWAHLQQQFPELLAGLSSTVVPKKSAHGTLYRLQAVGLSKKRARMICNHLKAKSQSCVLLRPARA